MRTVGARPVGGWSAVVVLGDGFDVLGDLGLCDRFQPFRPLPVRRLARTVSICWSARVHAQHRDRAYRFVVVLLRLFEEGRRIRPLRADAPGVLLKRCPYAFGRVVDPFAGDRRRSSWVDLVLLGAVCRWCFLVASACSDRARSRSFGCPAPCGCGVRIDRIPFVSAVDECPARCPVRRWFFVRVPRCSCGVRSCRWSVAAGCRSRRVRSRSDRRWALRRRPRPCRDPGRRRAVVGCLVGAVLGPVFVFAARPDGPSVRVLPRLTALGE